MYMLPFWAFVACSRVNFTFTFTQASPICPSGKSNMLVQINKEGWWSVLREKPKYSKKNLSQCYFVHHKSHTD